MKIAILKGFWDMLPLNLAVLPWGVLFGSLAVQSGLSPLETQFMSLIVFAGSAQLVALELISQEASLVTLLITTFVISSRHLLYGLSIRQKMQNKPLKWRLAIGFLLTDELFAFSHHTKAYRGHLRMLYALSAGGFFYLAWNLWTLIGIIAGQLLPDLTQFGLDFAIAAIFIALVIPSIKNLATLFACLASGISMIIFKLIDVNFGLIFSAIIGMSVGYILHTKGTHS